MQNKLIAATLASSAAALQLQSPAPTMLAQAPAYTECHGTYAYQCIEQKVETALGEMVKDVDNRKKECILTAEEMREDIVEEAQNTRFALERQLEDLRYAAVEAIKTRMQTAKETVGQQVDQAIQDMCDQLEQYNKDTHPAAVERQRVEGEIKKVYYGGMGGQYSAYDLKDKIADKVDAFNAWLEANYPKAGFGEPEIAKLQEVIDAEQGALDALIASTAASWDAALKAAAADMETLITDRTAALELRIAEKTQLMNDVIADLAENFIVIYWDTVEEIYKSVNYYERQGLVWKALYQKDAFLAEVGGIRDWLIQGLADVRSQMVSELNDERLGFADFRATQRALATQQIQQISDNLQKAVNSGLDRAGATQAEKGELVPAQDEKLEKFVYELSELQQAPKGHGNEHGNGYQPYAKWVSKRITDNIDAFGVTALELFDSVSLAAVDTLMATLAGEKAALTADNTNAQTKLDATTAGLIDDLVNSRQQIEIGLEDWQAVQEQTDEAARDIDQIALITTKNECWRELSWIIRQTHAGFNAGAGQAGVRGGHEHGYSAGPVFGYISQYAQVADEEPGKPFDKDYIEPYGFGSEGQDDGYDPYGYGDYGYGYGYAQTQFKEIQEKLDKMDAALKLVVEQNEARIAESEAALAVVQDEAWAKFEVALDAKWVALQAAIDAQNKAWEETLASRTATIAAALDLAKTTIYTAKEAMVKALDESEKEIRWAITSVYNYDTQDALNVALTEARAEMDAICDARIESLRKTLADVRSTWEFCVERESNDLVANTEEELARCEAAKASNTAMLETFKQAQRDRFAAWAAEERRQLAEFVAQCKEAWEWIKVSYCLKHGKDDDIIKAGHGCSWGQGSGYGNGGFKKGVAIEEHDYILQYGQELDIKHIHHEQKLIKHAVDFTMQGVPEEDAKQQALVDVRQAEIEAEVKAARAALEQALTDRLDASVESLDQTVARLADELLAREDAAIAGVDETRQGWEQAVDALREKLLWDIKEIVWRLGYTQGYHYGAHDGHDEDLLAQIAAKKDEYEALIQLTLQEMENRVRSEQALGDEATAAARAELDAEQERLLAEMNAAIEQALADMETVLAVAKQNKADEIQRAKDALYAFIDARLEEWGEKARYEDINAKWQEDSYYRYNLLRLLAAKQAGVDAAVAAAKASFNEAMAEENQEGVDFRAAQRAAFTDFTNATRQALVDAINQDDVDMEAIITERTQSLDARLAEQQDLLIAAMQADREEMRLQLKEVYSYNSYEYQEATEGTVGAYNHEQHQAFLHKFSYYLKDVLRGMDAGLAAMVADYNASIASLTDAASDQNKDLQEKIGDQREDSEKACERHAENLLELFADTQDAELGVLRDARDAAEEEMRSRALGLKKDIIYAMHVIRYAGGKDLGAFGFGQGASSFHGKGNSLTGIDELDLWRAPNRLGYAQVSDVKNISINKDDHHHVKLQEMLADAKVGFDEMIQKCRDDFAALVELEKSEATGRMDAVNDEMAELTSNAAAALAQTSAEAAAALDASNAERQAALEAQTKQASEGFVAVVDEQLERTTGWFNDKLEWVEKLYDSAYKTHIINELQAKIENTVESLNKRRQRALDEAAAANQRLADAQAAEAQALADFIAAQAAAFAAFREALLASTAERGAEINAQYAADADAELVAKNETADEVVKDWAFWLKYLYGYQGYETSLYLSYDDTVDYSAGLGPKSFGKGKGEAERDAAAYATADGPYLDLGYQGTASTQGGYPHLSGFGYGGVGGHDYIFSGDETGLAYGTEIGPNKQFFTGSVLDRKEDHDLHQMLEDYASSYTGLNF